MIEEIREALVLGLSTTAIYAALLALLYLLGVSDRVKPALVGTAGAMVVISALRGIAFGNLVSFGFAFVAGAVYLLQPQQEDQRP